MESLRLVVWIVQIYYCVAEFVVAGYLPEYRAGGIDYSTISPYVTDVILFSSEPNADGKLQHHFPPVEVEKARSKLKENHNVRVLLSLGGGGRSTHFNEVFANPSKSKKLRKSLTKILLEAHLDGIDFDVEAAMNSEQQANFASFITSLRDKVGTSKLLTTAIHAGQPLGRKISKVVDRVHLMTYDMQNSQGKHSTLNDGVKAVEWLTQGKQGVEKSKICLGVPFYGRGMKNAGTVQTFGEIYSSVGETKFNPASDVHGGLFYNGPETIALKAKWAKQHGIAGLMIWELGQDSPDRKLLKAAGQFVEKPVKVDEL